MLSGYTNVVSGYNERIVYDELATLSGSIKADISDAEAVGLAFEELDELLAGVDVLINAEEILLGMYSSCWLFAGNRGKS
jgi:NAD(P)-dependent dehydrogenase (short-subunit alcohol dehydrogenase family)